MMVTKTAPDHDFSLDEVAAALFARAGITSGLWRLAARLQFTGLTLNLQDSSEKHVRGPMPAGVVGVDGLALFAATKPGDLVFDAAEVLAGAEKAVAAAQRAPARKRATPAMPNEPKR